MKALMVGIVLLMTPLISSALTPQQYCEKLEKESKNSIEILNADDKVKMCVNGRFCIGEGSSVAGTSNLWLVNDIANLVRSLPKGKGSNVAISSSNHVDLVSEGRTVSYISDTGAFIATTKSPQGKLQLTVTCN